MIFEEVTWFALAAQIVGFVVWIVRLEGKVNALKERHDSCQERRQLNEDKVLAQLNKMDRLLAELNNDVKWLVNGKKLERNEINEKE